MLDKNFFNKYQKYLLWLANRGLGRRFLKIKNDIPRDKAIIEIRPNSFTWVDRIENGFIYKKTDFRTHSKFSKRFNTLFNWLPFNTYRSEHADNQWFLRPKFGLTTSTFYPNAGTGTAPVDAMTTGNIASNTFATIRAASGDSADNTGTVSEGFRLRSSSTTNQFDKLHRGLFGFDTSSIPDSDDVSSATLSFYGFGSSDKLSQSVVIDRNVPTDESEVVAADHDVGNWDGVEQSSTRIAVSSWSTAGYNDFTLNSTGIGNVSKTGNSWYGIRGSSDFDNSAPTWSSLQDANVRPYWADQSGTSNDPKLVVEHAEAVVAGGVISTLLTLGVG